MRDRALGEGAAASLLAAQGSPAVSDSAVAADASKENATRSAQWAHRLHMGPFSQSAADPTVERLFMGDASFRRVYGRAKLVVPLAMLRLVPKRVHLLERSLARPAPFFSEPRFDMREAPLEFGVGAAQRGLGIDFQMAGEIGDDEEKIADLVTNRFLIAEAQRLVDLVRLLAELGENRARVVPVEADLAGHLLEL